MSHTIFRVLYLVVPLGLIAAFLFRPTPIVGVDGESLAASTGAPVNEINSVPCTDEGDDVWTCTIPPDSDPEPGQAGPTSYQVTVDSWGCWRITGGGGPHVPTDAEGCVTIADHVASID